MPGLVRDLVTFGAPLLPYAAWKLWYFGDLLPNPFYAKTGTSLEHLKRGWDYALDVLGAYGLFGMGLVVAGLSLLPAGLRGVEARLLAIAALWSAYVVLIGGDVLYLHRFWLHVLPLAAVLLARGVTAIAGRAPLPWRTAAAVALGVLLAGAGFARNLAATQERRSQETVFVTNMTATGIWLRDNLPPGSTIAIATIGAISFHSGLRVIDMLGLTDREVAREPELIEGLTDTWREIQYNAASVLRRAPDAIFFSTSIRPSSAAEKALFCYEWFHRAYYPYYFRSTPYRTSIQNCFMRRPDAPAFDAARVQPADFEWIDLYSDGHLAKSKARDNAAAVELFRGAAEKAPPVTLWPREWWGVSVYDAGDTTQGLAILRDVAARDRYATVARGRLAEHAMTQRDFATAKRLFEEMRAVDPHDNVPWVGLAEIARTEGDLDTAFAYAREGVRLWEISPRHLLLLGVIATQKDEFDIATRAFQRALALEPNGEMAEFARQGLSVVETLRARPEARP